jgi:putative ABC transport system ATP-binding protein
MLTLVENVMLAMDFADIYDFDERPERAMAMLKLVSLEKLAGKLPVLVSTGQQQLAAIARALACDPPLLVADEPTGNLDTRSANTIIDLFEQLAQSAKTVVMVTHDPSLSARTNRHLTIADGLLVADSKGNHNS